MLSLTVNIVSCFCGGFLHSFLRICVPFSVYLTIVCQFFFQVSMDGERGMKIAARSSDNSNNHTRAFPGGKHLTLIHS